MNLKNLLACSVLLLSGVPAMAQDAVVVETKDGQNGTIVQTNNGDTVTTVARAKRQTTVIANTPATGARQTTTVTTRPGERATVTTQRDGQDIVVTVNNQPVTFAETSRPLMISGRVMVPLRGVTERLGGNVLYDEATRVITGAHPGSNNQFRLRIGSTEALLNGQQMALETPPQVVNGTTYVPLRFVSEALGAKVNWTPQRHTVVITVTGDQATVSTANTP